MVNNLPTDVIPIGLDSLDPVMMKRIPLVVGVVVVDDSVVLVLVVQYYNCRFDFHFSNRSKWFGLEHFASIRYGCGTGMHELVNTDKIPPSSNISSMISKELAMASLESFNSVNRCIHSSHINGTKQFVSCNESFVVP
jgi:hypothetical protein